MAGRIQWEAQVDSNIAKLLGEAKELRDQLDGIKKEKYEIKLNIDEAKLEKVITNLDKMLESIGKGSGDFKEFEILSKNLIEIVSQVKNLTKAFDGINSSGINNLVSSIQSIDKSLSLLSGSINKEFKDVGKNIDNNTNKINEQRKATEELAKANKELVDSQKDVTSPSSANDNFQEENIQKTINSAKKLDETLEKVDMPTEVFDEVLSKLDLSKSKLNEIVRITKQAHAGSDGKMIESYVLKDSTGSTETYGASSKTEKGQMLAYKYISDTTKALEEQNEKYSELNRTIDRYATVRKRIASGKALSSDEQEAKALKEIIDELNKTDIISNEQHQAAKNRLNSLETSINDIVELTKKTTIDSMQSSVDSHNKRFDNLNIKPSSDNRSPKYQTALDAYKNSIVELESYLTQLRNSNSPITKEEIDKWDKLANKVDEASNSLKAFSAAEKGSNEHSREKEIDKITKYLDQNTRISKTAKKELKAYLDLLKNGDASVNVQEIHTAWTKVAVAEREAGREGKSFFDILKDKAVYGYAAQLAGYYLSLHDFIRYARLAIDNVIEIDTAITELRKVSDATESRLTQNFKNSTETAKDLGASIRDVISATADWSRMGYNVDDAEELARISTLYKNVGDGIDIESANASLISTLQGFQLTADDAEGIIDKFNEVANNFAIDSAGIGEALQRSAASFNAANTDLSKSIALITATNEVVQDPDSVGTLWKTLSARIRGATTELEGLGEETDEYTESTSKLRDLVMGLTGFDIMEDEDTFKDIYEIILGIGEEWENLTDIEQASLGEALAGKRNANALYAVLGNLDTLQDAYKTAEESAGSAMREQENYEKSIQYSLDRLSASVEEWSNKLVSSDVIKFFVDLANAIVNLSNAITPLGTLALGTGGIAFFKNLD